MSDEVSESAAPPALGKTGAHCALLGAAVFAGVFFLLSILLLGAWFLRVGELNPSELEDLLARHSPFLPFLAAAGAWSGFCYFQNLRGWWRQRGILHLLSVWFWAIPRAFFHLPFAFCAVLLALVLCVPLAPFLMIAQHYTGRRIMDRVMDDCVAAPFGFMMWPFGKPTEPGVLSDHLADPRVMKRGLWMYAPLPLLLLPAAYLFIFSLFPLQATPPAACITLWTGDFLLLWMVLRWETEGRLAPRRLPQASLKNE
jgi:hypothetical protein